MDKPAAQNIQDAFLNSARRERINVVIHLLQGATLSGRIKSFDKFSLILESSTQEQLIFKHAISTISQARRSTGELRHHSVPAPDPPAESVEDSSAS